MFTNDCHCGEPLALSVAKGKRSNDSMIEMLIWKRCSSSLYLGLIFRLTL